METKKILKPKYVYKVIDSPVGKLKLVASENGLAAILWENDDPHRVRLTPVEEDTAHSLLVEAEQQLNEYFNGERKSFSLRLDPGGTPFQDRVWQALLSIPFGQTRSYGELAEQLGSAKASRAVGAANGRNPIAIVVPCHRVIGASGELTGFAGGLEIKKRLLALEGEQGGELKRKNLAVSRPAKRA
ncbi:MAG: methylated-DNA--[protein]-cysteine S-methyltransferase [Verrucomicrobia bacterium]|nr:methylated-DNA--[protein]-cysteine S-methyltransferase [Verrucomicrobiota bacterium]